MEIVLGWLLFSVVAGVIAGSKGRSGFGYFFLSLFLSPLVGLLFAVGLPALNAGLQGVVAADAPTPYTHVRCPDCRELVLKDARRCKHCGTGLVPESEQTDDMLMAQYGITKNGAIYHYKQWRYDRLADAIRQAEKT